MPSGVPGSGNVMPNLKLENFVLTIAPDQIKSVIKHVVEAQNLGYNVTEVLLECADSRAGGFGQPDIPSRLVNVEVWLEKKPDV